MRVAASRSLNESLFRGIRHDGTFDDLTVLNAEFTAEQLVAGDLDGDGTLLDPVGHGVGEAPSSVVLSDLDGNGGTDIVVGNQWYDTISVLLNDCAPSCPADLDGDRAIGFADLLLLLEAWGPCTPPCPPDFDGSGDVGFSDVLQLLAGWGSC